MKKIMVLVFALFLVMALQSCLANAVSISTYNFSKFGSEVLADTEINQHQPDTPSNYNNDLNVVWPHSTNNNIYRIAYQFAVSNTTPTITASTKVLDAEIHIKRDVYLTTSFVHDIHCMEKGFVENLLTWNNQPSYNSTNATPEDSKTAYALGWYVFNVTLCVQRSIKEGRNASFTFKANNEDSGLQEQYWDTKESGTNTEYLLVSYEIPTPEPPVVNFVSQNPATITTTNVMNSPLNITFNMSQASGINESAVSLSRIVNNSQGSCHNYINGSAVCGWETETKESNYTNSFSFSLDDNDIYEATYNLPEQTFEDMPHLNVTLSTGSEIVLMEFQNVSNTSQQVFLEAQASATATANLLAYYCNSSYSTGNPSTNSNCQFFYTLLATQTFNHSHSIHSKHNYLPMPLNITQGKIGNVKVTPTSYILLLKGGGSGNWKIGYIPSISRATAAQTSSNNGNTYSALGGTFDSHIHQFQGDECLWYYATAKSNDGLSTNSTIQKSCLGISSFPPGGVDFYKPVNTLYTSEFYINWSSSMPVYNESIDHYGVMLYNYSPYSLLATLNANNGQNLTWDWFSFQDYPDGEYLIGIRATSSQGLYSDSFSEQFGTDWQNPELSSDFANNSNYTSDVALSFSSRCFDFHLDNIDILISNSTDDIIENITSASGAAELDINYNVPLAGFKNNSYTMLMTCSDGTHLSQAFYRFNVTEYLIPPQPPPTTAPPYNETGILTQSIECPSTIPNALMTIAIIILGIVLLILGIFMFRIFLLPAGATFFTIGLITYSCSNIIGVVMIATGAVIFFLVFFI